MIKYCVMFVRFLLKIYLAYVYFLLCFGNTKQKFAVSKFTKHIHECYRQITNECLYDNNNIIR